MRWVTVRKAGLDALACAWLIRRFIDRDADILFASWSGIAQAVDQGFIPFHVPGYPLAPQKGKTVFAVLLAQAGLSAGSLRVLADLISQASHASKEAALPMARGLAALEAGLRFGPVDDAGNLCLQECILDALVMGLDAPAGYARPGRDPIRFALNGRVRG
jgi:hypothetical protein